MSCASRGWATNKSPTASISLRGREATHCSEMGPTSRSYEPFRGQEAQTLSIPEHLPIRSGTSLRGVINCAVVRYVGEPCPCLRVSRIVIVPWELNADWCSFTHLVPMLLVGCSPHDAGRPVPLDMLVCTEFTRT